MAQEIFLYSIPTYHIKYPRNGIWTISLEFITAVTKPYAMRTTANRFSCKPPLRKLAMEDASICKLTVKMNSTNQQKKFCQFV